MVREGLALAFVNTMTARGNRWFCNEADAVAAGRRPVKP
jgi:hypothetical protein